MINLLLLLANNQAETESLWNEAMVDLSDDSGLEQWVESGAHPSPSAS